MSKALSFLFVLMLACCSCGQKPDKEIIYKDYSMPQLKEYLAGDWLDINQKQDDASHPYFWRFDFSGDDHGKFQDYKINGIKTYQPTDAPSFSISEEKGAYYIRLVFYIDNYSSTYKIVSISNIKLVLLKGRSKTIYKKIHVK